jgi:ABC-type nitrate/sulfonate/bicarbonate transport system permease component
VSLAAAPIAPAVEPVDLAAVQARARAQAAARRARRRWLTLAIRGLSLAIFLIGWQLLGAGIAPVLFTTPTAVFAAAVDMIRSGELWTYLAPSLTVLAVGLLLSAVFGITTGLVLARFWPLDVALDMYVSFLYSIPTVALVPVIVLWAGFDSTAKIIIVVFFAFFPLVINTYQGVRTVDPKLLEVGAAFRCSEGQLWRHIVLPAALPFIITGLRLAVGRALIGMVLADLYTAISGIGYLISRSAATYRVDRMFVPLVVLGLLGIALTALVRVVERRLTPWAAAGE